MTGEESGVAEALNRMNKILFHRSRLGVCVLLARHSALSFSRLRELLNETDGNLGAQLKKLEEAGFIYVKKEFVRRKPVSWYSITEGGRRNLSAHLEAMDKLAGMQS
jgi:DNA-binding MarR family transcriptional regulator